VIAADGRIYVGVNQGLWAVSASGEKIWSRPEEGAMDSAPVALAGGLVLFNDRRGAVLVLEPDEAIKVWSDLASYGHGGLTVATNGLIYGAGGEPGALTALRPAFQLADTPWPKFRGNRRNTGAVRNSVGSGTLPAKPLSASQPKTADGK
jgi:hypothetical protein